MSTLFSNTYLSTDLYSSRCLLPLLWCSSKLPSKMKNKNYYFFKLLCGDSKYLFKPVCCRLILFVAGSKRSWSFLLRKLGSCESILRPWVFSGSIFAPPDSSGRIVRPPVSSGRILSWGFMLRFMFSWSPETKLSRSSLS